jgi:hypothetical protein
MTDKSNLLISCLIASFLLGSCSESTLNNSVYPLEVRETFISSCVLNAEKSGVALERAKDYCDCVFQIIQKEYSLKEFSAAEQDMLRGEASSINWQEISSRCV